MCGIVGYIGAQEATPIILDGLKKLEYRGYDSAGICTLLNGQSSIRRSEGKLVNLEKRLLKEPLDGTIGIGHTRWATHGRPSETNAHPHKGGPFIVVHNGIIENYLALKEMLIGKGHTFKSETDTEVISHLLEESYHAISDFEEAVRLSLGQLRGAYAVCILCEKEPDLLIAAKLGSPMVVGLGNSEFFVASDIPAILAHTREMVFMEDGEMVVFRGNRRSSPPSGGEPRAAGTAGSRHIDWSPSWPKRAATSISCSRRSSSSPGQSATPSPADCWRKRGMSTWRPSAPDRPSRRGAHHHHCLRHLLARRAGGKIPHRGALPHPGGGGYRLGIPLPKPDHQRQDPHGAHLPVRGDGRHPGGASAEGKSGSENIAIFNVVTRPSPGTLTA